MNIRRHFSNFYVAGFTYYDGLEVIHELELGTHLFLKHEPENPYDTNAVAIYYHSPILNKDVQLGYIPRSQNPMICLFLKCGHTDLFEVQINQISKEEHSEKQIGISVKVRFKEKEVEPKKVVKKKGGG